MNIERGWKLCGGTVDHRSTSRRWIERKLQPGGQSPRFSGIHISPVQRTEERMVTISMHEHRSGGLAPQVGINSASLVPNGHEALSTTVCYGRI